MTPFREQSGGGGNDSGSSKSNSPDDGPVDSIPGLLQCLPASNSSPLVDFLLKGLELRQIFQICFIRH